MSLRIEDDNREAFRARLQSAIPAALEEIGLVAEGHAKKKCPVDTGRLRNSITHAVEGGDSGGRAVIGTNVEYAAYVELGTSRQKAQPYLKPAAKSLYRKLLNEAGIDAKRVDAVLRVADLSKVTVKDGAIEGKADLVKAVKDEWKDFIPTTKTEGVNPPNPPEGNGDSGAPKTMKEISEIKDASERQAAIVARLKAQEE